MKSEKKAKKIIFHVLHTKPVHMHYSHSYVVKLLFPLPYIHRNFIAITVMASSLLCVNIESRAFFHSCSPFTFLPSILLGKREKSVTRLWNFYMCKNVSQVFPFPWNLTFYAALKFSPFFHSSYIILGCRMHKRGCFCLNAQKKIIFKPIFFMLLLFELDMFHNSHNKKVILLFHQKENLQRTKMQLNSGNNFLWFHIHLILIKKLQNTKKFMKFLN